MPRTKTPSFVVTRRVMTGRKDEAFLEKKYGMVNRMHNAGVTHCRKMLEELKQDDWYQESLRQWKASVDEDEKKKWAGEVFVCAEAYGLSEYALHAWLGAGRVRSYGSSIGANIVQKIGTGLYTGVKKALFGKKLHYRKWTDCRSFEDKSPKTGIIYHRESGTVTVMGREMRLKPVRDKDYYLKEAMGHRVKYCRIVREPFGAGWRYFLQLVLEGYPPAKVFKGPRTAGLDPGTSTMACYRGDKLDFIVLSPEIRKYKKAVVHYQNQYSRRMQENNADCLEEDGRYRKGCRIRRTGGMESSMAHIRSAYRKQSVYVRQTEGRQANLLADGIRKLVKEPMNYKALQKRSRGPATRSEAPSKVKDNKGREKTVYKYRKKKRFGHSLLEHAPSQFVRLLEEKVVRAGGTVEDVDIRKYRASQIDHTTGKAEKHGLGERTKMIGGARVQRDCYSSFLLMHEKDKEGPDLAACRRDFRNYLKLQEGLVDDMKKAGDPTGCFGLKDWNRSKAA